MRVLLSTILTVLTLQSPDIRAALDLDLNSEVGDVSCEPETSATLTTSMAGSPISANTYYKISIDEDSQTNGYGYGSCCKVCTSSQACGNSCISWSKSCHKGPGCACQG